MKSLSSYPVKAKCAHTLISACALLDKVTQVDSN